MTVVAAVQGPSAHVAELPRLRAFTDAMASTHEVERLMAHGIDWVARSVPAGIAIFSPVDHRLNLFATGPLIVRQDPGAESCDAQRACREYVRDARAFDPFAPSRWANSERTVLGIADVGGQHAFARSSYREFLASHGVASQASMFLRDRGRIVAAILLLRRLGEPEPTPADTFLLCGTQPLLEQAHALARRLPIPAHVDVLSAVGLTRREIDVARLAAGGATNAEIARALFLSLATVKTHMTRVLAKTGARSRIELVTLLRAEPHVRGAGDRLGIRRRSTRRSR